MQEEPQRAPARTAARRCALVARRSGSGSCSWSHRRERRDEPIVPRSAEHDRAAVDRERLDTGSRVADPLGGRMGRPDRRQAGVRRRLRDVHLRLGSLRARSEPGPADRGAGGAGDRAAVLIPCSLTLLTHSHPGAERARAVGIWAACASLALSAGPLVGGVLIEAVGWRAIFFIDAPLGVLGIALTLGTCRDAPDAAQDRTARRDTGDRRAARARRIDDHGRAGRSPRRRPGRIRRGGRRARRVPPGRGTEPGADAAAAASGRDLRDDLGGRAAGQRRDRRLDLGASLYFQTVRGNRCWPPAWPSPR